MTKKDYELIARAIRNSRTADRANFVGHDANFAECLYERLLTEFCGHLGCDNPRFDDDTFRAAAQPR